MFLAHEPAHVREEEPALDVVGIGIRLCVFVMHAVVTAPHVDVSLKEIYNEKQGCKLPMNLMFFFIFRIKLQLFLFAKGSIRVT